MNNAALQSIDRGSARDVPSDQVLYTPEEAEELLKLDALWLKRQARAGRIPHWRMGKFYRFTDENLSEIARLGSRQAAPPAGRGSGRR